MKRMFVFLFVIICLCAVFYLKKPASNTTAMFEGQYYIYLSSKQAVPSFAKSWNNGDGQIVCCDLRFSSQLDFEPSCVAGSEIKLDASKYTLEQVCKLLNFRTKKSYEFSDGLKTFYGESDFCQKFLFLQQDKINCQIAINNGAIHIGFPILLGSY